MKVTIIDYGLSNLLSVQHAFAHFGAKTLLTGKRARMCWPPTRWCCPAWAHSRMAWPGWKSWAWSSRSAKKPRAGTPLLGICLGMQMLFDESEEFGLHKGLGLIPGRVVRIPATDAARPPPAGAAHQLGPAVTRRAAAPILAARCWPAVHARRGVLFYPQLRGQARRRDGPPGRHGLRRPAQSAPPPAHGSVVGCQFHPEKSGEGWAEDH